MPVFADSVRETHPEDYELLHYGHVHLYRNAWALERLLADLAELGYATVNVDLSGCVDGDTIAKAITVAVPDWPAEFEASTWATFADMLPEHLLNTERPLATLVLRGFNAVYGHNAKAAVDALDYVAGLGRWYLLFGRRLICLIETNDEELNVPDLGAEHVRGTRHEFLLKYRSGRRPPWIS